MLLALSLGASPIAYSQEIYVIAHPTLKVSIDDVKEAYLGDLQFRGPVRLKPVHHAAHQTRFVEAVLGMSADRYGIWWTKKAFRDGLNPPDARATDEEIIAYVSKTLGGLGYVTIAPAGDVTIIGKAQIGTQREGRPR
jgi:hypothetical protein